MSHPFHVVPKISEAHAAVFVDALFKSRGAMDEALSESGIMEWPTEPDTHLGPSDTPEQVAYMVTQDAIAYEIARAIRPAMMMAFRVAATRILILGLKVENKETR